MCEKLESLAKGCDRHMHINFMDWDAFMIGLWVVTVIGVGGGLLYVGRRL